MLKQRAPGPIRTMKSRRPDNWRGLTSIDPGVIAPVAFFPLLREDAISGTINIQVKSEETVKVILNPVRVRAHAFLVPKTALPRFGGSMEVFNRSYEGEAAPSGFGQTPAFFMKQGGGLDGDDNDAGFELYDTLGIHYGIGAPSLNTDLAESYNVLVNWLRKNVLEALPQRPMNDVSLAEAFWDNARFAYMQPSFDAAAMEGAVPLPLNYPGQFINHELSLPGNGTVPGLAPDVNLNMRHTTADGGRMYVVDPDGTQTALVTVGDSASGSISLANIETAKETQAFAMMRDRYKGVPDEYLVDLLMSGIRIPDDSYRAPMLIGQAETVLGQQERYATDGASLDTSVSNMMAMLSLRVSTPPINPGGIVLVCVEVVPEQLFERVADPALIYYGTGNRSDAPIPDYVSDYLDPQKVEVVQNREVDVFHSTPDGVFGYAPLNYKWQRQFARVGGKYKRPKTPAFSEERQRIWSAEAVNPTLGDSFYLCPKPFPKSVFAVTTDQPYEVFTVGEMVVTGITVFGPVFGEDQNSYDEIIAQVDTGRIDQGDDVQFLPASDIPKGGEE